MITESTEKPWIDEATKVANDIIRYGFAVENRSLGYLFMQELGLNKRFPSPRSQSRRHEVLSSVRDQLHLNGYNLMGGLWRPDRYMGTLSTLQQLPENVLPEKIWEQLKSYARAEANVSAKQDLIKISGLLAGQDVIEIGPGYDDLFRKVVGFGGRSYVGVDPFTSYELQREIGEAEQEGKLKKAQARSVNSDGLTFLLDQPDNSAVILSFCVFSREMLVNLGSLFIEPERSLRLDALIPRYWDELAIQVYRTTKQEGFVFHGFYYDPELFDEKYLSLGFHKDRDIEGLFWKR